MPIADSCLPPDAQSSSKLSGNGIQTRRSLATIGALANAEFSTGLRRDFHGVTPTFPWGNPEISTALPQPADIRAFIERQRRPVSELRVVALHAPSTPILLCYDETGRKSSEIAAVENRHWACRCLCFPLYEEPGNERDVPIREHR